jgi:hypothetical protein
LGVLPHIVDIRKKSDRAAMRWSLERMMQELREPQPGGFLVAQHLKPAIPIKSQACAHQQETFPQSSGD